MSEIILQQTRVEQGLPYYERFVEQFADVKSLAKAKEEKVLKLWQGLGYYSRGRNLHKAAKIISAEFKGVFPKKYKDIRKLPGIGDYTAAAIASFAFKLNYPVLDGNVYRFISRLFGISTPIDTPAAKKEFMSILNELIVAAPPDEFNQAIMEFGALHCTPRQPDCAHCIFKEQCVALSTSGPTAFPVKSKKTVVRERHFNYLVIREKNSFYLKQRTSKDIWMNLWEFPMIESSKPLTTAKILKEADLLFNLEQAILQPEVKKHRHLLTHQTIHATFFEFKLMSGIEAPETWKKINGKNSEKYPLPKLIENYLKENK